MSQLRVFASDAALEVAVAAALGAEGGGQSPLSIELGRGLTSVPRLFKEASAGVRGRALGALGERLLLRALCADSDDPELARRPIPPSLAPRLGLVLAALRRAAVKPAELRAVAPRLPQHAAADARWLAAVLTRYEARLGDRLDEAALERAALTVFAGAPIAVLAEVDTIEIDEAAPLEPRTRLLVEALAARGLTVRCAIPEPPPRESEPSPHEAALLEAIASALDALEAIDQPHVERAALPLEPGPAPRLLVAPSDQQEALAVARAVRDAAAVGAACDELVVAAAEPTQRARIAEALIAYGLPVERPADERAGDVALARLVPTLYRLAAQGVGREGLATLLGSGHLQPGRDRRGRPIGGARIAAALREALPESTRDWDEALLDWAAARSRRGRDDAEAIAAHAIAVRDRILGLPEVGTLREHTAALGALLDTLGVTTQARRFLPVEPPAADAALAEALHREQAALRVLFDLLDELPRAANRAGLAGARYDREEVAALLQSELQASPLRRGGARGAAVQVCDLGALTERPVRLLVLAGMDELALVDRDEDPLLHDETLRTLGRALGRPLFAAPGDGLRRIRLRLARARSRAGAVLVTTARTDASGAARVPGELIAQAGTIVPEAIAPVRAAELARTPDELLVRLLFDREGEGAELPGLTRAAQAALRQHLSALMPERLARVEALAALERSRVAFFDGDRPAGRHDGRLGEATARAVAAIVPGGAQAPLSASTLARYVECPHRFFLESVLRLRTAEETHDELDERAGGGLAHLALERLFIAWRDEGLLPLSGREAERAAIAPALDSALSTWRAAHPIGSPVLFEVRRRALLRLLEAVWQHESAQPAVEGLVPALFEHRFDGLVLPEAPADEAPAYLRGVIDRIDLDRRSGTRAAVVDYKSGRSDGLKRDLREEALGETSWQLPLYAAIARAELGVSEVEMVYYSLREVETIAAPAPAWAALTGPEPPDGERTLPARLWAHIVAMRQGRYDVAPRLGACDRCHLKGVCRIAEPRGGEDVPEESRP